MHITDTSRAHTIHEIVQLGIKVQLTAKFILICAIHTCVIQFYSSDVLELVCHTQVRLCVPCILVRFCVKSGVLHLNKAWGVQSYSTLLYCVVILIN